MRAILKLSPIGSGHKRRVMNKMDRDTFWSNAWFKRGWIWRIEKFLGIHL